LIAPDANLLIYAHHPTSPFHKRAKVWLEDALSGSETVGIPTVSIYGFLRFITNPAFQSRPLTFASASAVVASWISIPNTHILHPGDRHWEILRDIGTKVRIRGGLVTDAVLAATAIEYGAIVHTNDRDFARFPGLRWHNPLE
jgi:toxin-antitoxin system PIN domain toxin